jgi:hypothetical protein
MTFIFGIHPVAISGSNEYGFFGTSIAGSRLKTASTQ